MKLLTITIDVPDDHPWVKHPPSEFVVTSADESDERLAVVRRLYLGGGHAYDGEIREDQ